MRVLIVESNENLGNLWQRHLSRLGCNAILATTQSQAIDFLQKEDIAVIVLDLVLEEGSAFAIADYASYRQPDARVVFVTNTTFFSDGSIFQHIPNAYAFLQSQTPPEDLAEMVHHYGMPH